MQHRMAALILFALLTLCACGSETDAGTLVSPVPTDPRQDIAGTYEVSGSASFATDEGLDTRQVKDFLRIEPDRASRSGISLSILSFESQGCGPQPGEMTSQEAFSLGTKTCPLPMDSGCTSELVFDGDRGRRTSSAPPTIQVDILAQLVVACGSNSASAQVTLELSGPRRRLALPEPAHASMTAGELSLNTALSEFARALNRQLD